jgi:hypothetical protein
MFLLESEVDLVQSSSYLRSNIVSAHTDRNQDGGDPKLFRARQ